MNTKQKLCTIYFYKGSQGAEQHTKRLFLAWHSGVWHKPDAEAVNIFLNAHMDRISSRNVHMSESIVHLQTCLCVLRRICTHFHAFSSPCMCIDFQCLIHMHVRACVCVCDSGVWRAASPSSMESTEVQADPMSHKINLQRAMLTSLSVSPQFTHSVILLLTRLTPPCLWLTEWAVH